MRPLLLIGATGILGRAVAREAERRKISFVGTCHVRTSSTLERLDASDPGAVYSLFSRLRPGVVINAAGLTKALCKDEKAAWLANAFGPHVLAAGANTVGARLLHVSTDCVFRGNAGPYSEADSPDADDVYGRSKAAGEVAGRHLTLRTSFIGSEVGTSYGLLSWFAAQTGEVPGFRNHLWSGVTADWLAGCLLDLGSRPEVTGILHVPGEDVTKAELLRLLKARLEKDVTVRAVDAPEAIDRRLRSDRIGALGIEVPPIVNQLKEMYRDAPGSRASRSVSQKCSLGWGAS